MGRPIPRPRGHRGRSLPTTQPQDRGGHREPVERTAVASILSLEPAHFLPLLSLCNQASAADHAQPLRLRRQAIKYTSSYHCLTHTWGLRLKTLFDPRSGASPFAWGLRPSTHAWGLRPSLGGFAFRLEAPPFDPRSGALPFDLRSGASPLQPVLEDFATRSRGSGKTYKAAHHP
jgi:hypothetical protein